ncbi:MAG: EAL domain-containing protein [Bdellovibrio bacteriovorus]
MAAPPDGERDDPHGGEGALITVKDVREALRRGELFLEYLPLMAVPEGRCVGGEALVRWRRNGGVVMPNRFIPLIEETPVSGLLTYCVIETLAAELGNWLRGRDEVHIGINIPPEILGRGALEYAAERAGLLDQAPKLVLEITERGYPDRQGATALSLAHRYGTRVALDDVTFSGRNLVVLARCSFDIIKIDRSLIAQIGGPAQPGPPPWLDHLSALRKGASLEIIAEGVETREQLDTLVAAGVSRVQGFYFSRPLSAADFIAYHAAHR